MHTHTHTQVYTNTHRQFCWGTQWLFYNKAANELSPSEPLLHVSSRSLSVGILISVDYWWTTNVALRGLDEVTSIYVLVMTKREKWTQSYIFWQMLLLSCEFSILMGKIILCLFVFLLKRSNIFQLLSIHDEIALCLVKCTRVFVPYLGTIKHFNSSPLRELCLPPCPPGVQHLPSTSLVGSEVVEKRLTVAVQLCV